MNIIVNFLVFFCLLKATYSRYTINSENGIGANFEDNCFVCAKIRVKIVCIFDILYTVI